MRIGLVSDSHGQLEPLQQALLKLQAVDLILHAGDLYQDALCLSKQTSIEVQAVAGNCDAWSLAPRERILEVGGFKLWLLHGHRFSIKRDTSQLVATAEDRGVDIVVFGHTHRRIVFRCKGILFVNPGSVADGRGSEESYGLLEIEDHKVCAQTFSLVD